MPTGNESTTDGTPASEFELDAEKVRALLADQHEDLSALPITLFDVGWDNYTFRLGSDLAVRLPRRAIGGVLIEREQKWLPQFAERATLPIPAPVRLGKPALAYPWPWSVVPWIKGDTVNNDAPGDDQALVMARFLAAIQTPAPEDAPFNDVRGVALSTRAGPIEDRMAQTKASTNFITPAIERLWREALDVPIDMPRLWLHGDLHARNVLCKNGKLAGVIDWGDMTAGDIASDLSCVWHLFETKAARAALMEAYTQPTEATWIRAKGWAVLFAVLLYDTGRVDSPVHRVMGEKLFARLEADA